MYSHGSVHRESNLITVQKDATVFSLLYFCRQLYMFRVLTPIIGSSYRGADKSLARPGRKQSRKHVRDARDFNDIETRAVIKFFPPARQGAEGNSRHSDRNISLFHSWSD